MRIAETVRLPPTFHTPYTQVDRMRASPTSPGLNCLPDQRTEPSFMLIRVATLSDAIPLAELKRDTFRETFLQDGFGIDYPPNDLAAYEARTYSVETITGQLNDPECRTWVAESDDGTLVGYAHAGPCKLPHPDVAEGSGEIHQIYLRRGTQGTGAGRALFDSALDYLATERPGPVWLGVWSGNAKAIAFYEKAGFTRVGTYDFKVGESTDLEFIYRR
ncbi:GNAT family N-acetyltransferase [Burkholderia cepacia]|uniref:GNAT family N-acetyltransferase n=1 Tax=Burkholderia cepacia TaxID=292 RepID=UPI00234A2569|nr:GNAT family N-acetyltransferase [Burkholderia cepacia]MDC6104633.1 GNAT family N-acetyltransferase [Burkholderia cepacia]